MLVNYFGLLAAVFRIRQGSTDGPPGWALISDILLKVYHRMSHGCQITDPTKTIKVKCNTDMFVDDATLMHNDKPTIQVTQLMQRMQHNANVWGGLLWTSRGLLEFLKGSYFLVIWAFAASGRPRTVPEAELPPNTVTVTGANGCTAKLHKVTEEEGIKMLGVEKAATLIETTELTC
eukprot:9997745-Ditylum_brightwellii.AAC.1